RPDRALFGLRRAGLLGLVGVDQDHEVVTHRPAHALDLGQVVLHCPVVEAQLDRAPALGAAGAGVLAALLARAELDAARVAWHAVAVAAPELVERLAARLADHVPQRDFDAPGAAGV